MSDTPRTDAWLKKQGGKRVVTTFKDVADLASFARILEREVAAKQAQIDRLMLEYCPDEMTQEQVAEWAKHQVAAGPDEGVTVETVSSSRTTCRRPGDGQ